MSQIFTLYATGVDDDGEGKLVVSSAAADADVVDDEKKSNSTAGALQVEANLLEQLSEYLQF